ncbi:MAG: DUF4386 family protein [Betaproteobacteria bacterium]|nr:MAG: DUF4386 family protein [Betaproteobacteria bacterium]
MLFRVGLAGEMLTCVCDVALAMILYFLLRPVSRNLALLAAFFRLTFVGIYGVTKLFEIAALVALGGADYPDGCAAIAYEMSSAYWGRGLARKAVQVIISELVGRYRVRSLPSVLKRENLRSMRLLERLGFSLASPEQHAKHRVEPGELLMLREIERA